MGLPVQILMILYITQAVDGMRCGVNTKTLRWRVECAWSGYSFKLFHCRLSLFAATHFLGHSPSIPAINRLQSKHCFSLQVAKYVPASALQIALLIVEKRSWTKPSHDPTGSGKERELLLDNQIRERPAFYCYNGPTPKRGEGNGSPLRHY